MTEQNTITGGCQCGAVRFRVDGGLGRASICHCRMCQKATGGFFSALVTARDVVWTRDEPAHFRSSNKARRGFCAKCGTPLTYEIDGNAVIDVAIGALDHPEIAPPVIQVHPESALACVRGLADLPPIPEAERQRFADFWSDVVSYQHVDRE